MKVLMVLVEMLPRGSFWWAPDSVIPLYGKNFQKQSLTRDVQRKE